uniref:NADH dehydrogenase subunit 2 n=1 Tax=Catostylus townsendi TaxID=2053110 RepID=UPI001FA7EB35|nr:NADH dehydrogenase subunit 2 [Catostylus townsendi]UNB15553.1 NADH dehydrogenase subunit 2 [Catostylus townsendi]
MIYTFYEILLLVVLILSLVIKIPLNYFNRIFILILITLFVFYSPVNSVVTEWEYFVKLSCLIIGVACINFKPQFVVTSTEILIMCVILASMVMVSCTNLLGLYLCLELQSLSVFILLARKRQNIDKVEASLKYFVLSSISSGLYLLGASLMFMNTGSCDYIPLSYTGYSIEKSLLIVALLFKLAASPFHFWAPDVYQGSDNKALIVLGTLPKISIFGIFIILFPINKLVMIATILSLLVGAIGAINQANFKRLLAYSSILGMGFVLFGLNTMCYQGLEGGLIYLIIYLVTFLAIIIVSEIIIKENSLIIELSSFLSYNKILLSLFTLLIFSLAGIPPLGGFIAKWFVISSAITQGFIISSILSIICAMVAGVYYLRLIKISYFEYDKSFLMWKKVLLGKEDIFYVPSVALGCIVYFITFLLLSPQVIYEITHYSAISIF